MAWGFDQARYIFALDLLTNNFISSWKIDIYRQNNQLMLIFNKDNQTNKPLKREDKMRPFPPKSGYNPLSKPIPTPLIQIDQKQTNRQKTHAARVTP